MLPAVYCLLIIPCCSLPAACYMLHAMQCNIPGDQGEVMAAFMLPFLMHCYYCAAHGGFNVQGT